MAKPQEGFVGNSAMHEDALLGLLEYMPKNGMVLEIGTLHGASCGYWASQRPETVFVSVDPFLAAMGTGPGDIGLWMENKQDNMRLVVGTLREAREVLMVGMYDVIFVDGDHSYEGCLDDCRNSKELMTEDGLMIVHDYGRTNLPHLAGVTQAVDEFLKETGARIVNQIRTIAIIEGAWR